LNIKRNIHPIHLNCFFNGFMRKGNEPFLIRIAHHKHIGPNRISQKPRGDAMRIDKIHMFFARGSKNIFF